MTPLFRSLLLNSILEISSFTKPFKKVLAYIVFTINGGKYHQFKGDFIARKKLSKKISDKIEEISPEPKKYKKVEIKEISQKIPQNARFGIVIAVAILWVQVIRNTFIQIFDYYEITTPMFTFEFVIAVTVTFIAWLIFLSWTKLSRRIGRTKINIEVKPRNGNNKGKKR